MNVFSICRIKKEIAYHFFHKSDILYRFLIEYHHNDHNQHLSRQYNYITKQFSKNQLISHIEKHSQNTQIHFEINEQTIELSQDQFYVALHIYPKQIKIYCDSLHSAEQLIFPTLRLFHPLLFILNENNHQYGWISPFIKSDQTNKEEVLYSLR